MIRIGFLLLFLTGTIYPAEAQKSNSPVNRACKRKVPPAQIAYAVRAYRPVNEHTIIDEFIAAILHSQYRFGPSQHPKKCRRNHCDAREKGHSRAIASNFRPRPCRLRRTHHARREAHANFLRSL